LGAIRGAAEKSTEHLRRYENQIQQQYNRAYKRLRQMQDVRKNAEPPTTPPPEIIDTTEDTAPGPEKQNKPDNTSEMFETQASETVSNVISIDKETEKCPGSPGR